MEQEQLDKLLQAIRAGTDLDTSCHYAGLSTVTVYRDLERGKTVASNFDADDIPESEKPYYDLWQNLVSARADAIVRNVASIQQAARNGSWQAAAWWLERVVPESYSKTSTERPSKPIDNKRGEIGEE